MIIYNTEYTDMKEYQAVQPSLSSHPSTFLTLQPLILIVPIITIILFIVLLPVADSGFLLMLKAGLEFCHKTYSCYLLIDKYTNLFLILLWLIERFSHKCWKVVDHTWPELIRFVDNVWSVLSTLYPSGHLLLLELPLPLLLLLSSSLLYSGFVNGALLRPTFWYSIVTSLWYC